MLVVDSSVAIAAFASWHDKHEAALQILDEHPSLVAHAALETYSVLTRLPPPHRAPAGLARQFLAERFPSKWLALADRQQRDLLERLAQKAITGGRVYDALIGAVAARHDATLATCDRRASGTYGSVGARIHLLS